MAEEIVLVRVKRAQADWKKFVYAVLINYEQQTNCKWGWILYDWIVENGHLPEEHFKPTNSTLAKSQAMDEIIANKILTIEHIKNLLASA